jgi:homocysteine S-methyltransferase
MSSTPFLPNQVYVYDGPMETRIEYGTDLKLDKEMSIFALVDSPGGRQALAGLYWADVKAAKPHGVPIILNAPTYRCSPAHAERMGYSTSDLPRLNKACLDLVQEIRDEFAGQVEVLLTAPVGPKHAGYHPGLEFTVDMATEYHQAQAEALKDLPQLDLISVAAMPGMVEAYGAARAVAATGKPYTIGFILDREGNVLDGTPVRDLIATIDENVRPAPLFYVIGCTHVSVARALFQREDLPRIQAIKANGSSLGPEELLALDHPAADDPELFAAELVALGRSRAFRILGGCCGTDTRHVDSLCREISKIQVTS